MTKRDMTFPMPEVGSKAKCFLFDPPQMVEVVAIQGNLGYGACSSGTLVTFKLPTFNKGNPDTVDSFWFTSPNQCGIKGYCEPIYKAKRTVQWISRFGDE